MTIDGYTNVTSCPVCGSAILEEHATVVSHPFAVLAYGGINFNVGTVSNYVKCAVCGLYIQSPRLNDEKLMEYYRSGVYRQSVSLPEAQADISEQNRAKRLAAYLKERHIEPESHLDFGAARGHLLKEVDAKHQYGFDLFGYYEKGQIVLSELVSSVACLEHCADPMKELKTYRECCTKYLLLEAPGVCDNAFRFPHLYVFPAELLMEMVVRAGFKIIDATVGADTTILAEVD